MKVQKTRLAGLSEGHFGGLFLFTVSGALLSFLFGLMIGEGPQPFSRLFVQWSWMSATTSSAFSSSHCPNCG